MIRPLLALALTLSCCGQYGVVYPRSIVPGGVEPGFERIYPHASIQGWVNYRDGGEIKWSAASIPAWETVLIDRAGNLTRARCGNSITLTRPEFVLPPVVDIDAAEVSYIVPPVIESPLMSTGMWLDDETPLPVRGATSVPPLPALPVTYSHTPGPVWIPAGIPFPAGRPVKPGDVITPEPSTWGLFLVGMALWAFCSAALRRQRKEER